MHSRLKLYRVLRKCADQMQEERVVKLLFQKSIHTYIHTHNNTILHKMQTVNIRNTILTQNHAFSIQKFRQQLTNIRHNKHHDTQIGGVTRQNNNLRETNTFSIGYRHMWIH